MRTIGSGVIARRTGATVQEAMAHYQRLIETAEHFAATAEFQSSMKMYHRAIRQSLPAWR